MLHTNGLLEKKVETEKEKKKKKSDLRRHQDDSSKPKQLLAIK
jgi:hypothetical protein